MIVSMLMTGTFACRASAAVARQHSGDLDDMLLGLAVHYLSEIELDSPHAVARLEDDRRGAQLGGADLERGARAQRAIQEQQCEGPALQQRPYGIGPEARRLIEKRLQFPDGPVLGAGEVSHGPFCF